MVGPAPPKKKTQAETIDELMNYLKQGGSLGLEIEKRLEELPPKYVALFVTQRDDNELLISNLVKNFIKKGDSGIFVTLNKSGEDLKAILKKNGVDCTNLFVVDAISRKSGEAAKNVGNMTFVDSPQDLTEMEAQISDFVEKIPPGRHFFILDSISTMMVYNAEKNVEKFVHKLGERLKGLDFQCVFTIMDKTRPEVMNVLSQFSDKVIKPTPQIKP